MPEGDTIHRTANRLKPVLEGKTVRSFSAPRLVAEGPKPGTRIDAVEAKGKYLLVHFGDGTTLETHMKMTGSWHMYRAGERWRRAAASVRAAIETEEGWVAVCFSAPHVKLVKNHSEAGRTDGTAHLGPDLCTPDPDIAEAVRRFNLRDDGTEVAVALLDQRVCCGVGNVYKSEVLFACGVHPSTPLAEVGRATRTQLVETVARLLRMNLDSGPRVTATVGGRPGLAVYGRAGKPCIRCGRPVMTGVHGLHARKTYWCDTCQPFGGGLSAADGPPDIPGQET